VIQKLTDGERINSKLYQLS